MNGTRERFYFAGIDPAPAQGKANDDGAISILRAMPTVEAPEYESDFQLDFIYDRAVRDVDIPGWSGLIHEKERDFGFARMVMDWGGGGQWIYPELAKRKQIIGGAEVNVRPIVPLDSQAIDAAFILSFVLRRDSGMQALWPDQLRNSTGDDVLKSLMHVAFREAWMKGLFGVAPRHAELVRATLPDGSKFTNGWTEERVYASVMGSRALDQMGAFGAATRADGSWDMTKNGAHRFTSRLRDDFVDSRRNAYTAFRIWWVQESEGGFRLAPEDSGLFS